MPTLCDVQVTEDIPGVTVVVHTPIPWANHNLPGADGSNRMSPFDM